MTAQDEHQKTRYAARMPIRMLQIGCSFLIMFCASGQMMNAQSAVRICGVDLKPGIGKEAVIDAMSPGCEVKRFRGPEDLWCARPNEKMTSDLAAYEGCHYLEFASGSLVSASREVAEASDDKSANIINEIYAFVQTATERRETVTVSLDREMEHEGWRFRTINLIVRHRSLALSITQPVGATARKSTIRLLESVGSPSSASSNPR